MSNIKTYTSLDLEIEGIYKGKNIVLFSGGVDSLASSILLFANGLDCKGLYVDFGHKYAGREKQVVSSIANEISLPVEFLELNSIGGFEKENVEIPLRNLLLVEMAVLKGADNIFISVEEGTFENESRDRSPEALDRFASLLSWIKRKGIYVYNLVESYTKQDEMQEIIRIRKDGRSLLQLTYSCYEGRERPCGKCSACLRWWLAGKGVGIDRDDWEENPQSSKKLLEYVEGVKMGKYSGKRSHQYKEVFKRIGIWDEV